MFFVSANENRIETTNNDFSFEQPSLIYRQTMTNTSKENTLTSCTFVKIYSQ